MSEELRSLIDALRKGDFDHPEEKVQLLAAALKENGGAPLDLLLKLLTAPQALLRRAALLGCRCRGEPELIVRFREAAKDEDSRVREALAKALQPLPDPSLIDVLGQLCRDNQFDVQVEALKASAKHPSLLAVRRDLLLTSNDWRVQQAAAEVLEAEPQTIEVFFKAMGRDTYTDVQRICAQTLERKLVENAKMVAAKAPAEIKLLEKAEKQVLELGGEAFPNLLKFLQERTALEVSAEELGQFGVNLSQGARDAALPKAFCLETVRKRLTDELLGERPRSLVILGEPGVGKTALVYDLAHWVSRPENGGWQVLRMSPTDFVVGTTYIGEWETRVSNLVKTVKRPRRVILYVPNLGELPGVGKHSKGEHNVLTALAPFIQEGSVLLLGESTAAEFDRGFRRLPAMRALFKLFLLDQPDAGTAAVILQHLRDAASSAISDEQLDQMVELADQFIPGEVRPGNAVRLFQSVRSVEARSKAPIATRQILEALASSSGLPADLLDDEVALDLSAVRSFFESRVLGQADAINVVVELVTLIKAGLTDPMKPLGVFLFVGPTGVGKTELARAVAEYIFGDANKLQRFDMSEYATPEGFQRLIESDRRGSLTNLVRQSPFSVVLLDEIEKSNVNVFDLCLQLFDAGRLTDDLGRTTDFRKTIIVLTSNVGATTAVVSPIGFRQDPIAVEPDKEGTFRELSHFFRPEFLNRIDRIVYFRPLELQVAENIARKEIERVLNRAGIKRRKMTVEVDPTVVGVLLKEGYSPTFGARPLKRAVEKLLLLPVARIIASGKSRGASLLRLASVDGRIEPQLIFRPEAAKSPVERVAPDSRDLRERATELQRRLAQFVRETALCANRKTSLLEETQEEGFYKDTRRTTEVFAEIHRLDQFLEFTSKTETALADYVNHVNRSGKGSKTQLEERFRELKRQVWCIGTIAESKEPSANADALLELSLVLQEGEKMDTAQTLARAYLAYIARLPLGVETIAEGADTASIYLQASGVGACALLSSEAGLHEFTRTSRRKVPRTGKEAESIDKELLRVSIWPILNPSPSSAGFKIETRAAKPREPRLLTGDLQTVSLFDAKSVRSVRLITSGPKTEAIAKAATIFTAQSCPPLYETPHSNGVIRRYEFGIGSKARDLRSGLSTPHLDRLFKGQLEILVMRD